jgi:GMP synthase-like glutamine amidotransferase
MRFHCLQHVIFETPGLLTSWIRQRGHSLRMTYFFEESVQAGDGDLRGDGDLPETSVLPSVEAFDVLVIMGGPMSVHDEAEFPWLRSEKALIAAAVEAGKKILGICLGAQLVAEVMGGRVYRNPVKEIGFWPVRWTEEAIRLFSHLDEEVFHWHGETFDLPPGATLLASSEGCVNQAFRVGENVLALQFHPEVTPGIIDDMIRLEGHELEEEGPYIGKEEEMRAKASVMATVGAARQDLLSVLLEIFLHP